MISYYHPKKINNFNFEKKAFLIRKRLFSLSNFLSTVKNYWMFFIANKFVGYEIYTK